MRGKVFREADGEPPASESDSQMEKIVDMKSTSESTQPVTGGKRRRVRTTVVGVVAAGLLLGGGVMAANAANGTVTAGGTSTASPTTTAGPTSTASPSADTTGTAARHAKVRVLRHALRFFVNGDSSKPGFGDRAAKIAANILDKHPKLAAKLPGALQGDLKALKDAPESSRVAAATKIRESALNGGYGEQIQKIAKQLQERKDAHAAS